MYKYFQRRVWQWILRCDIKKKKQKTKKRWIKFALHLTPKLLCKKTHYRKDVIKKGGKDAWNRRKCLQIAHLMGVGAQNPQSTVAGSRSQIRQKTSSSGCTEGWSAQDRTRSSSSSRMRVKPTRTGHFTPTTDH